MLTLETNLKHTKNRTYYVFSYFSFYTHMTNLDIAHEVLIFFHYISGVSTMKEITTFFLKHEFRIKKNNNLKKVKY